MHGLYQPDAIKHVVVGDHEYIITANEGEEKEYEKPDFPFEFSDGQPGKYFVDNDLLDDSVPKNMQDALADESQMGKFICAHVDLIQCLLYSYISIMIAYQVKLDMR